MLRNLINLKKHKVEEVFTPTTSASINYVIRKELEKDIEKNINIPGKQIIIYGHSGSGKTTIIRKTLERLHRDFIITICDHSSTFENILKDAFDKLNVFENISYKNSEFNSQNATFSNEAFIAKSNFSSGTTIGEEQVFSRIIPTQLTPQNLAACMGKKKKIWIIEDFHKICETEKIKIADTLKIFVDNANDYPESKIICIGACESVSSMIRLDPNLQHRISETKVNLLTDDEIRTIIDNGCKLLNIEMEEDLIDKIVYNSARLASSAHQMCLDICMGENIQSRRRRTISISNTAFTHAINGFVKSNEHTMTLIYESAIRNELGWYVLKTFEKNSHDQLSFAEIKRRVNDKGRSFTDSEIKSKLDELQSPSNGLLFYNTNSEKYKLSTPFWKSYLHLQFYIDNSNKKKPNLINQKTVDALTTKILLEALDRIKQGYNTIDNPE